MGTVLNMAASPREATQLLFDGAMALSRAEQNGLTIDVEYCVSQEKHLTKKMDRSERKLKETDLYRVWNVLYGKDVSLLSDPQLGRILFKEMKHKPISQTKKGNASVNEVTLIALNDKVPGLDMVLEYRKNKKLRDYIRGFMRESVDEIMRPFFNLNTVITFRSSSDSPNFQNIPNRDPVARKITRRAIKARPGHQLGFFDYGGVEVKLSACYHHDPNMINYILDPKTDMHRDMAMEAFKLTKKQMTKAIRHSGKNEFVFPQFYGDWYKSCAAAMWNSARKPGLLDLADGTPMLVHLKSVGIRNLKDFEKHMQKVETNFWEVRFAVYNQWKEDWWTKYKKTGLINMLTGFICKGVMTKKDVTNYPIQGAAFHCLLWSFVEVDKELRERNMNTRLVGQIHDEIVLDIDPAEKDAVLELVFRIMSESVREHWKWIIVPLEVEAELAPVDCTWYDKEVVEFELHKAA